MSIPGIPSIVRTENIYFRVFWAILVLTSFSVGLYNISDLTRDYYKYEVITNVERVSEENFTFPAVTICLENSNVQKYHFKNNTLIKEETDLSMKNFIDYSFFKEERNFVSNQLEFFILPQYEIFCTRFNGASNQNLEKQLAKINKTNEFFYIRIKNNYTQTISENEYFLHKLNNKPFVVFIEDNYLNSFTGKFTFLKAGLFHFISIVKSETEEKLDEPYSQCKKSTNNQTYLQNNCVESCIYSKIGTIFNCTFNGLFKINGLKACEFNISFIRKNIDEHLKDCTKECPIECESMKFSSQISQYEPMEFSSQISLTELNVNTETAFGFFVSDLSFLKITQIPKTSLFSFISADIGGALGLFMGVSALNFIEILEFIVDISLVYFFSF